MMRTLAALLALLLAALPARAQAPDQIDYILLFPTPAAALAAGELAGVVIPACPTCSPPTAVTFSGAQVISGTGLAVYETTAITSYNATTAPNCPCETRTYLHPTEYWVLVSTVGRHAAIEGIGAPLILEADRTLACAGAPASQFILANNSGLSLATLGAGPAPPSYHIEPLFGCDPGTAKYPSSNPYGLGGGP